MLGFWSLPPYRLICWVFLFNQNFIFLLLKLGITISLNGISSATKHTLFNYFTITPQKKIYLEIYLNWNFAISAFVWFQIDINDYIVFHQIEERFLFYREISQFRKGFNISRKMYTELCNSRNKNVFICIFLFVS